MKKDYRFILLVGLVLAMVVVYGFGVSTAIASFERRGQFGDMFGGLNALFSALAFAAITYSLFQQREDLRLQRDDLEQTRAELAKTAKLSALSTLAQTYSESLTWMEQQGKTAAALSAVSGLHKQVIRQTEELCGVIGSLYDE